MARIKRIKTDKERVNALIEYTLKSKFEGNVDGIMQVLKATENPVIAAEILLGIYKEPEIPKFPHKNSAFNNYKANIEFVSYDPIKDSVTYSYQEADIIPGWVSVEVEDPKEENIVVEGDTVWQAIRAWNKKANDHNARISAENKDEVMMEIFDDDDYDAWNKSFKEYEVVKKIKDRVHQDKTSLSNWLYE